MSIELKINLAKEKVGLEILGKDTGRVDFLEAKYYHDISTVLITALDRLLKRNKLDLKVIKGYKIQGDLGKDSTSYKIAAAFILALQVNC